MVTFGARFWCLQGQFWVTFGCRSALGHPPGPHPAPEAKKEQKKYEKGCRNGGLCGPLRSFRPAWGTIWWTRGGKKTPRRRPRVILWTSENHSFSIGFYRFLKPWAAQEGSKSAPGAPFCVTRRSLEPLLGHVGAIVAQTAFRGGFLERHVQSFGKVCGRGGPGGGGGGFASELCKGFVTLFNTPCYLCQGAADLQATASAADLS